MVIGKENQSWVSQLMIAFDDHGVKFVKWVWVYQPLVIVGLGIIFNK
jgi:hypothetical protein